MSSRNLTLAVVVAMLTACAAPGAVDAPVARNLTWFSYVGGDDIRAGCVPGAVDRYRLVYNAVYTDQVRCYDVETVPAQDGAFHLNAFLHPSPRFDRLRFLPILTRPDPSDIAFNPPRKLERLAVTA